MLWGLLAPLLPCAPCSLLIAHCSLLLCLTWAALTAVAGWPGGRDHRHDGIRRTLSMPPRISSPLKSGGSGGDFSLER